MPPDDVTKTGVSQNSQLAFLKITGSLLLLTGMLQLVFSILGLFILWHEPRIQEVLSEGKIPFAIVGEGVLFQLKGFVAVYVFVQILSGWLFGLFTALAGWLALFKRQRHFVLTIVWLNLLYFPLGTTIGAFILMSLRPRRIQSHFES